MPRALSILAPAMKPRRRLAAALLLAVLPAAALALAAPPARAHDYALGELRIDHPMAFATPPNARTGAAYMTIENRGAAPDRLLSAHTPAAAKAELHATIRDGDVVRMRAVAGIAIAPGAAVRFQRGALHVMLAELRRPLKAGEEFPLTLVFERAGAIEVSVQVEATRGPPPAAGHHAH